MLSVVRIFSILAIVVVASSSLPSLINTSSRLLTESQHLNHYDSYVDEKSNPCLDECACFNVDDDGYLDTEIKTTAGAVNRDISPQEWQRSSWSSIALLSLLWYLCFKSLELHQLALVIGVLFFTGRANDVGIVVSFLVVGLLYLCVMAVYGANYDELGNIYDDVYYHDEPIVHLCVVLGRITWVVSSSRNHY